MSPSLLAITNAMLSLLRYTEVNLSPYSKVIISLRSRRQ
jgi:hypothetical protein